jgi:hypothetical protein
MEDHSFITETLPHEFVKFLYLKNTDKFLREMKRLVRGLELSYDPNEYDEPLLLVVRLFKKGIQDLLEMAKDPYFDEYVYKVFKVDLNSIDYDLSLLLVRLVKLEKKVSR